MKPFKVNRDSWHYKLNKSFLNDWGEWGMEFWEDRHANFCSYWRATIFRLVFGLVVAGGLLSAVALTAFAIWSAPAAFAASVILIIGLAGFVLGGMYVGSKLINGAANIKVKPDSLFAMKYMSYKSKVCPSVEYDK